jgi:hypothetical protein
MTAGYFSGSQAGRTQTKTCIACRKADAAPGLLNCAECYSASAATGVSSARDSIAKLDATFPGRCGCPYALSRGHLHSCPPGSEA